MENRKNRIVKIITAVSAVLLTFTTLDAQAGGKLREPKTSYPTQHKTVSVDGVEIFYREAGPKDAPTHPAVARIPDLIAHVPQPDPGPFRPLPPGGTRLSRLRQQRAALDGGV